MHSKCCRLIVWGCVCLAKRLFMHRNWRAVAEHMGTRDHRAVASHAQKHFIRLCIDGQLLPAKVLAPSLSP